MKIPVIFYLRVFIFLVFYSCSNNNQSNNKLDTISNKQIIGKWEIYVIVNQSLEMHCNMCPEVIFKDGNKVEVVLSPNENENYNYLISGDTLSLSSNIPKKAKTDRFFSDGKYIVKLETLKKFTELRINRIDNKYSCILRK